MNFKKNFNRNINILLVFLILIALIFFVFLKKDNIIYSSEYYEKSSESLFKNYSEQEINYLFFDNNNSKIVDLWFPEKIDKYDFTNAKLYYENKLIEGEFYVKEISEYNLILEINDYIPKFDSISIKYNNKEFLIYTGKYFFELNKNLKDINNIENYIIDNHSNLDNLKYFSDFKLNNNYHGNLKVNVPSKALESELIKSNIVNLNDNNIYNYVLEMNRDFIESRNLKRVSVDILFTLQDKNNELLNIPILQSNIPFQINK